MDVESLAGHLLPAGSVFRFLAEHRHRLFPDALFADLFPSGRGRPSIPGEVIASVIVLQALNGLSDREAVEALTFDLRWKAACGYPVDKKAFDASSLTVWRARLAASERPQRIFEVVRDVSALGMTVLLVEQNAEVALRVSHYAYVLESGKVVKHGAADVFLHDPDIKKAYLGL